MSVYIIIIILLAIIIARLRSDIKNDERISREEGLDMMRSITASGEARRQQFLRSDASFSEKLRVQQILSKSGIPEPDLQELAGLVYIAGAADAMRDKLSCSDAKIRRYAAMSLVEDARHFAGSWYNV